MSISDGPVFGMSFNAGLRYKSEQNVHRKRESTFNLDRQLVLSNISTYSFKCRFFTEEASCITLYQCYKTDASQNAIYQFL